LFKALGHGAKDKHFRFRNRLVGGLAIAKDTGKLGNLRNPTAINLFFALDAEIHD
jgi:hypothetical protein